MVGKSKEEKKRRASGRRCWIFIGMVRVVISSSQSLNLKTWVVTEHSEHCLLVKTMMLIVCPR